jgi:hypothetical protein
VNDAGGIRKDERRHNLVILAKCTLPIFVAHGARDQVEIRWRRGFFHPPPALPRTFIPNGPRLISPTDYGNFTADKVMSMIGTASIMEECKLLNLRSLEQAERLSGRKFE